MIGVAQRGEPDHGHAGDPLQHFGDAVVGKQTRFIRDDGVDHGLGILLAVVGFDQRLAPCGDDDVLEPGRIRTAGLCRVSVVICRCRRRQGAAERAQGAERAQRQRRGARSQGATHRQGQGRRSDRRNTIVLMSSHGDSPI